MAELKECYMLETPKAQSPTIGKISEIRGKMPLMDNQQPTALELAWLAGLWDGEGTFTLCKGRSKRLSKRKSSQPYVLFIAALTNTSAIIVNEVRRLLTGMEIPHRLVSFTMRNSKLCYQFDIRRMVAGERLISALLPYLRGKKAEAELVLEYIRARQKKLDGKKWGLQGPEEVACFDRLQQLRAMGSETIRTPNYEITRKVG